MLALVVEFTDRHRLHNKAGIYGIIQHLLEFIDPKYTTLLRAHFPWMCLEAYKLELISCRQI